MGTVNFMTSEYITIGLEPYDSDDFLTEDGEVDYGYMEDQYREDFCTFDDALSGYDFDFFDVRIEWGYYDSFCILIEHNWGDCFDWKEDREEAEKEVDPLEKLLLECIDLGMCEVWPGWCTKYRTREESIQAVKKAMEELRKAIRETPIEFETEDK